MFQKIYFQTKILISLLTISLIGYKGFGQQADTLKKDRFSIHAQTTVISQFKPAFTAKYSGQNSLIPESETKLSVTATLFLGAKLWQGAGIFMNPEIAGGSGLSGSSGVGASANGETYRIADPAPSFELARLFIRQIIPLNQHSRYQESDLNTLGGIIPTDYFSFTIGKICVSDYFDNNRYSHDPRTQFMSWALMSNGAWDFPANTKGYTPSVLLEYVTPKHELRYAFSLVSTTPNGMTMNWNINKAGSNTLEYTYKWNTGAFRALSYFTIAKMGNYNQSIELNPSAPSLIATEKDGNTKYGFGINCEQKISKNIGAFIRSGWNDGKNETWVFTEIDRTASFGISSDGSQWNRQHDKLGLAYVVSGLSAPHRNYLRAGGLGFELGDGNLNYALEQLVKLFMLFILLDVTILSCDKSKVSIRSGFFDHWKTLNRFQNLPP